MNTLINKGIYVG